MSDSDSVEFIYVLFDKVAERAGAVQQYVNDATAVRDVCLKYKKSPYYKDMELRRVGAIDIKSGWCVECASCVVALPPVAEAAPSLDATLNNGNTSK